MIYIIGFFITIGVLVTIHEWGHYIVARLCGVHVHRFSIGFGKVLWQRVDKNGTEWAISAIPLGGYVKMLDSRNEEVSEDKYHQEFNRKPIWQRSAIVVAGPLVNLIFAFVLFVGLFSFGIKDVRPILGAPTIGTAAKVAGINGGEKVISINGKAVFGWQEIREQIIDAGINSNQLTLKIENPDSKIVETVNIKTDGVLKYPSANLGLRPPIPNIDATINRLVPGYPAELSGLKAGDKLISIDGQKVNNWLELTIAIQAKPNQRINILYTRPNVTETLNISVLTRANEVSDKNGVRKTGIIGIEPDYQKMKVPDELIFRYSLPFHLAVLRGFTKTSESAMRMVRFIGGIFTGDVSWRFLNGPFVIAEIAGKTLSDGLNSFIQFVSAVSISLGIINLFPLPVLDGGHLVFLTYEAITKKPPKEIVQEWLNRIGVTLVFMLMVTAIYNDLFRYFG